MVCCVPSTEVGLAMAEPGSQARDILLASRTVGDGLRQTDLSVPSIHCGDCVRTIERALAALPKVERARVNLSTRRVTVQWRGDTAPPVIATLGGIGYDAHLDDLASAAPDPAMTELVRALAVAGFAASNIMMLSVAVWSGADAATRDAFHWISAALALPALAYAGRPFFRSAWRTLRCGLTNMDVPISIGILLAFAMSLSETVRHGEHAYFDAAVSLLFFLLVGRTLDHVMRERARTAVRGLASLAARGALVRQEDGTLCYLPTGEVAPGMTMLLAAGERVPVDARVLLGRSALDLSLISGESLPQPVEPGTVLQAGTLNLTAPLEIVATAAAKDSFLAEMTRMMEAAEAGRSAYRRLADRAARLYAPVVHLTALATFLGWMIAAGDAYRAATIAIAVLIITCPCALGLAVPMVQVAAARRLFEHGIMLKDGTALERLAEIDAVVLDKTGTLTAGAPQLVGASELDRAALAVAAALASRSRHPYSLALAEAGRRHAVSPIAVTDVQEHPGSGLEGRVGDTTYRLGRRDWALSGPLPPESAAASLVLSAGGRLVATFRVEDALRRDAPQAVTALQALGLRVEILSGDRVAPVRRLAASLGLAYVAEARPGDKRDHVAARGRRALMVGDGVNDAPALAAAHVSMAPASAADIGRNAADLVFLRDSLMAVPQAILVARRAARLARQNLMLAVAYNAIAVPVAIAGAVTPLVAAVAMSLSSILVVGNALRLAGDTHRPKAEPTRRLMIAAGQA